MSLVLKLKLIIYRTTKPPLPSWKNKITQKIRKLKIPFFKGWGNAYKKTG